tara:strand:+ start:529 stop:708 length:180 start_codon:yes stop_codon:yes gene_type:complete
LTFSCGDKVENQQEFEGNRSKINIKSKERSKEIISDQIRHLDQEYDLENLKKKREIKTH